MGRQGPGLLVQGTHPCARQSLASAISTVRQTPRLVHYLAPPCAPTSAWAILWLDCMQLSVPYVSSFPRDICLADMGEQVLALLSRKNREAQGLQGGGQTVDVSIFERHVPFTSPITASSSTHDTVPVQHDQSNGRHHP